MAGRPKSNESPNSMFATKIKSLVGNENYGDFEEKCRLPRNCVSKFISGRRPRLDTIQKISEGTGCDLNWINDDNDTRPGPIYREKHLKIQQNAIDDQASLAEGGWNH